ncbi:a g-specific adenine glycosylase [Colletotrichum incanum]|uniref:A g-specific adenine glycosylase n=1 Tax=Colletotrichum incanum TaxID=1573173 RepID=A0A166LL34_COLIC|nr:a g-specific adenine glycosylase [Colletotrichum incanum]
MGLLASSKFDYLALLVTVLVVPSTALKSSSNVGNQCPWNPSGPLNLVEQCRVAYDPQTASHSSDWSPWTQQPVCVSPKTKKGPDYCAFVKEDFRGEAGILLITSPEIAAGDYSIVEDFNPQWINSERKATPFAAPPFEVKEIPGKGLGTVAKATIHAGDIILREYPVLLQLAQISEPADRMQALWVLEEGFIRLPIEDQRRVFDLSRSTGGHVLEDIIRTNTFGATFNNVGHFGLFPRVARINHACKPNAITRFFPRTLELEVVAYKDIQPGEELSISYSMLNMLYEDRKQTLQEWGFNCTCTLCSSPDDVAVSDTYRTRLQEILAELTDPAFRTPSLVAELTDELDDVMEREGLAAQAGEFYGMIARVYARMGEAETGRRVMFLIRMESQ